MIASWTERFDYFCAALSIQTSQQNTRLDLRARDRQFVVDWFEWVCAHDVKRRSAILRNYSYAH